ncbi:MAG TPA: hypothetical protein VF354_01335 [Candidatus Methanoperedens sp.]
MSQMCAVLTLTSLNFNEILYGMYKYADKQKPEKKGNKVPRFDAMIAAVAINRVFKLFTFNKDHFDSFEDLELF